MDADGIFNHPGRELYGFCFGIDPAAAAVQHLEGLFAFNKDTG